MQGLLTHCDSFAWQDACREGRTLHAVGLADKGDARNACNGLERFGSSRAEASLALPSWPAAIEGPRSAG